jgi:hypothetical protein
MRNISLATVAAVAALTMSAPLAWSVAGDPNKATPKPVEMTPAAPKAASNAGPNAAPSPSPSPAQSPAPNAAPNTAPGTGQKAAPAGGAVTCRIGDKTFEADAALIESAGAGPAARLRIRAEAGEADGVMGVDLRAQTPAAPGQAALLKAEPDISTVVRAGAAQPIANGVLSLEAYTPATAAAPGRVKGTATFAVGQDQGRCAFDGPVAAPRG